MILSLALSAVSGCLLSLAFPKFNLGWLAWLALVPFFITLYRAKNLKDHLISAASFGLVFFGIHLFWMMTLYRFVAWWIILGWLSLVVFQTIFILVFATIIRFSWKLPIENSGIKSIIFPFVLALVWTAVEWLRSWGPFGVSAGDLGYSQVQFLPLIQIAAFSTVYGVSFLVAFFNAGAALFLFDKRKWQALAVSLVLVLAATGYGAYVLNPSSLIPHTPSRTIRIALLQPNIDQKDKLNVAKVWPIFEIHEQMTRKSFAEKPDIIIWPETSIFAYVLHDSHLWPRLQALARESKTWLVLGIPHYVGDKAYNSVVSIAPSGQVVSRYDKEHLVPFGEYLPFRPILFPLLKGVGYYDSEFHSNPKVAPVKVNDLNLAAAVCFESTLPQVIRKRVTKDSDFILLVTNNAWFNDSSALYFHLNTGILRAIENRKYFVQVGNNGITAIIDPYGRVLTKTKTNQRDILTFEIPLP